MAEKVLKTAGQLERDISQRINALYRQELDHQPGKITCQLFENKLAIVIDGALSKPEQLLLDQGSVDAAEATHEQITEVLRCLIKQAVEELLSLEVVDIMLDSNLQTARSSIIVIFQQPPDVRNPGAIPKNPKK